MTDKLDKIFELQKALMKKYQMHTPDGIPDWPVDLMKKSSQRFCRDTLSKVQDELFEAKHMLKNAKEHRNLTGYVLDEELLKEELVDSLHFFVEALILLGIDSEDLFTAYVRKNEINHLRIEEEFCSKDGKETKA